MLYADNTGIVSQSPDKLRKILGMVMVVCAGFGLLVSEAKTEIICLRTNGIPEPATIFSVETAGQVYNQTKEFNTSRGTPTPTPTCPSRSTVAYAQRMVQLSEVHPRAVRPTERSRQAPYPDAKRRGSRDNAVRLRHVEPACMPLRHAASTPP